MADRNTLIRGSQIRKGLGLSNDATNQLLVKIEASKGIALGASGLSVDYDDSTIGIVSTKLAVKAGGIAESHLDINSAPTDTYLLKWNEGAGKLDYVDPATLVTGLTGVILESDVVCNEVPTGLINGVNTEYTLANALQAGTLQVYLNGALQQPGVGLDYTLESGDVITFVLPPDTNDIVLCNYMIAS